MILLVLISLSSTSQTNYLRTDSVCFSLSEAKEIVRWNEERKHIKDVSSVQHNKIQVLERQVLIKDTIYKESEIIRDTLVREVKVYHNKYRDLIAVNGDLFLEKEKLNTRLKKNRRLTFYAFSSSLFLALLHLVR